MNEKPILFNPEMVRAVLNDTKTQTRRVVKVQPPSDGYTLCTLVSTTSREDRKHEGKLHWQKLSEDNLSVIEVGNDYFKCPYGVIGDQLWVREKATLKSAGLIGLTDFEIDYCADREIRQFNGLSCRPYKPHKWTPSIFMPRWASRIQLEVTGVRVERVQDITEQDAKAEGVIDGMDTPYENGELPCPACNGQGVHGAFGPNYGVMEVDCTTCDTYIKRFRILWDSINANRGYGWDKNPWVFVIEFKKLEES